MNRMNIDLTAPLVTVLLPVYNSRSHLREAIESIQAQTYPNWELLAINEYGSNDGSADIIRGSAANDSRIHLIQNQSRLGLADSLNLGIQMAKGKYIARMDADDLAHADRFEKEAKLLEAHPEIGLCGSWQHHFGRHTDWVHRPPSTPEECRANLMFDCDLCHSTLMMRKQTFLEHHLFYDSAYLAEDFELWTRAVRVMQITNIPEVLGEYRWSGENISRQKQDKMAAENAVIVANALNRNLGIQVRKEDYELLEGWKNPFFSQPDKRLRKQMYVRFQALLTEIYEANKEVGFYEEKALLGILASKWRYSRYMEPRNVRRRVNSLDEIFDPHYHPNYWLIWKEHRSKDLSWMDYIQKIRKYLSDVW